jgi:hypothetical protein
MSNIENLKSAIDQIERLRGFINTTLVNLENVEVQKPAPNMASREIAEMSKSIRCLALELPGGVWDDVNSKWNAVLAQLQV